MRRAGQNPTDVEVEEIGFFFIKSVKNAAVSTFQVLEIFVKHELHFFTGARHGE